MNPAQIKERLEEISRDEMVISKLGNELWAERNRLRNEYKSLTGEEI